MQRRAEAKEACMCALADVYLKRVELQLKPSHETRELDRGCACKRIHQERETAWICQEEKRRIEECLRWTPAERIKLCDTLLTVCNEESESGRRLLCVVRELVLETGVPHYLTQHLCSEQTTPAEPSSRHELCVLTAAFFFVGEEGAEAVLLFELPRFRGGGRGQRGSLIYAGRYGEEASSLPCSKGKNT
ncbi:hypothetical protein cyc_02644 [Cyclospora cayetanensis]|uniref:Uncharacterized protein n=1 Tax=Cyclospora cayetanensis TaxID=88456 RepID=A0A1D3CRM9_9EIME|nr:hypothetical protein cyc_02644 [Cyclospora cayetanensis]